jgi:hypothetical protein
MISEVSVYHSKESIVEQGKSHHGDWEAKNREREKQEGLG